MSLSPDAKWAIASLATRSPVQLVLLPTGTGDAKALTNDAIDHSNARWFPDGQRFLFQGHEPNYVTRIYVQDLVGGMPRAISPEGVSFSTGNPISLDGRYVAAIGLDQKLWIYPVEAGEPRPVPGVAAGEIPFRWSDDHFTVRGPAW